MGMGKEDPNNEKGRRMKLRLSLSVGDTVLSMGDVLLLKDEQYNDSDGEPVRHFTVFLTAEQLTDLAIMIHDVESKT
jgi:hypothetical protein